MTSPLLSPLSGGNKCFSFRNVTMMLLNLLQETILLRIIYLNPSSDACIVSSNPSSNPCPSHSHFLIATATATAPKQINNYSPTTSHSLTSPSLSPPGLHLPLPLPLHRPSPPHPPNHLPRNRHSLPRNLRHYSLHYLHRSYLRHPSHPRPASHLHSSAIKKHQHPHLSAISGR